MRSHTHVPYGIAFNLQLTNPQNECRLIAFWGEKMLLLALDQAQHDNIFTVNYGVDHNWIVCGVKNGMQPHMPQFPSNLHWADSVFLLHASHTSTTISQVIVWSPDTDVAVLCMHYCSKIGVDLWFRTGTATNKNHRFIHINEVISKLGH